MTSFLNGGMAVVGAGMFQVPTLYASVLFWVRLGFTGMLYDV